MKQIYTKDKKVKITFRCDEALSKWVAQRADMMELTPSSFVRQLLFGQMYAEKTLGGMVNKDKSQSTGTAGDGRCKLQD
jgi:hypothetical protein